MERVLLLLTIVVSCIHFCYAQDLCSGSFSCTDPNSVCFDGSCVCKPSFYRPALGENCTKRVVANADCDDNITSVYQCADSPEASCFNGTCKCKGTHYVHNATCAKRLNAGSQCDSNSNATDQCVDQATCESDICVCQSDYFNKEGICTTRKMVGKDCNPEIVDQNQCANNSYCYHDNSTCICVKGYYKFSDTSCNESIQLKLTCDDTNKDTEQCAGPFARCHSSRCDCDDNHYHNPRSHACEERLTAGIACDTAITDSKQCVEHAHCSHFVGGGINTSTCVCDHDKFVVNGQCNSSIVPTGHGPSLTHPSGSPLPPIDELLKEIG